MNSLWIAAFVAASAILAPQAPLQPITPVEAIQSIGRPRVLVRMTVKHSKDRLEKRGLIYLDSEEDYQDPKNLGVAVSAAAAEKFRERGITDPASHFHGKLIEVKGCVMMFDDHPFLPVLDPDQIRIVAKDEGK